MRKHAKSFLGKGSGKPIFTKNGFPVKSVFLNKSVSVRSYPVYSIFDNLLNVLVSVCGICFVAGLEVEDFTSASVVSAT